MSNQSLLKQLNRYKVQYPQENEKVDAMIILLAEQKSCFERESWDGHFTGSAWVVDNTRNWVVLTHHRRFGLWLQLGGHADGNSNLIEVALKEATEESGLTQLKVLSNEIFDLDIHKIPARNNDPTHLHFDIRFILEADRTGEDLVTSRESYNVDWIPLDLVKEKNSDESMSRMVNKTRDYFPPDK